MVMVRDRVRNSFVACSHVARWRIMEQAVGPLVRIQVGRLSVR